MPETSETVVVELSRGEVQALSMPPNRSGLDGTLHKSARSKLRTALASDSQGEADRVATREAEEANDRGLTAQPEQGGDGDWPEQVAAEFDRRSRWAQEDSEKHRARGDDEAAQLARERERVYRHAAVYVRERGLPAPTQPSISGENRERLLGIATELRVRDQDGSAEHHVRFLRHLASAPPIAGRPVDEDYDPGCGDVLSALRSGFDGPDAGTIVEVDAISRSGSRWTSIGVRDNKGGRWRLTPKEVVGRFALLNRGSFAPAPPEPQIDDNERVGRITVELRAYPEVRWDRFIEYAGKLRFYGWLDRADGRADFLLLDFDVATGELTDWITSAHPHPASVVERLEGESSVVCQRVEDCLDVPNAVRLSAPPEVSGEGFEDISLLTALWGNGGKLRRLSVKTPEEIVTLVPESSPPEPSVQEEGERRWMIRLSGLGVRNLTQQVDGPDLIEVMPVSEHEATVERLERRITEISALKMDERDAAVLRDEANALQARLEGAEAERRRVEANLAAEQKVTEILEAENGLVASVRATRAEKALDEAAAEFERRAGECSTLPRSLRGIGGWKVSGARHAHEEDAQLLREKQAALKGGGAGGN